MIIVAITGRKASGKTTLIVNLVTSLAPRIRLAVIKHVHHEGVEFDRKGTDTWRAKKAGAPIVLGLSPNSLFLHADTKQPDPTLAQKLIQVLDPDLQLLILEGFYGQMHLQPNVRRILVARSIKEASQLITQANHSPDSVYLPGVNLASIAGVPIFSEPQAVAQWIVALVNGSPA